MLDDPQIPMTKLDIARFARRLDSAKVITSPYQKGGEVRQLHLSPAEMQYLKDLLSIARGAIEH